MTGSELLREQSRVAREWAELSIFQEKPIVRGQAISDAQLDEIIRKKSALSVLEQQIMAEIRRRKLPERKQLRRKEVIPR